MRLTMEDRMVSIFVYTFLGLLTFACFYPFWNTIVISINSGKDTALGGLTFLPRDFTWDNYRVVFENDSIYRALFISVSRASVGTALSIFFTALLAYGLSKKGIVGKKFYMILAVFTMYFHGGLIPSYLWFRELGLFNNFYVLVLPWIINVWNMIVFRTFFNGLPDGLEESARIDGCNQFGIFFRIVIPLSMPVIATLSLFVAVFLWNDWFYAGIYVNSVDLLPIQNVLINVINSNSMAEQVSQLSGADGFLDSMNTTVTTKSIVSATIMVATIPIIMVYPFVQRFFVKGVLVGSLKE